MNKKALLMISFIIFSSIPLIPGYSEDLEPIVYRGDSYVDTDLGNGTHSWESAPLWIYNGIQYVPYIFQDHYALDGFYQVQSGLIGCKIYDYYAQFFSPDMGEIRLYDERWEVQRWTGSKWSDIGAQSGSSTFTVFQGETGVNITKSFYSWAGTLEIQYIFREGQPLKHTVYFTSLLADKTTYRVKQQWAGIVGDKVGEETITTATEFSESSFRFLKNDGSLSLFEDQYQAIEYLQPVIVDTHANGMKAEFIFSDWTLAQDHILEIDPDTATFQPPILDGYIEYADGVYNGQNPDATYLLFGELQDYFWYRSFLRFNVSSIPDEVIVTEAIFSVNYYDRTETGTREGNIELAEVADIGSTLGEADWSSAVSVDYGVFILLADRANYGWVSKNVTSSITSTDTYVSFRLKGSIEDTDANGWLCYSSSAEYATTSLRPKLFVTYTYPNEDPTLTSASILSMKDGDNVYALDGYSTFRVIVNDANTAADIAGVYLRGMNEAGVLWEVRATSLTGTPAWTIESGSTIIDLATGSCSWDENGDVGTADFSIRTDGDHGNLENLELSAYVIDSASASAGWTELASDYWDAINRLVTISLAADDTRIDKGGSTSISGSVRYATTSTGNTASSYYPTDALFTDVAVHNSAHAEQGTDTSIVNGAFSISVTIPDSIQNNVFHIYIDMDPDWGDGDAPDGDTAAIIGDQVYATGTSVSDTRQNVNSAVNIDWTLKYDYDETLLTTGTVTIEGVSANHQGSGVWRISPSKSSVQAVTYNEFTATGNAYGISSVNPNGQTDTVIWDRFEIVSVDFDDARINIGDSAEVRYVLQYDYDSVSFTGSDGSIVGFSWDGSNSWWDKAVTAPSSPGADLYDENDLGAITDNNYAITTKEDDAGANLVGDKYNVTDFWASNYNPPIDSSVTLYAKFESLYDAHVCDGDDSITIEGLSFTYQPIEEYFFATIGKNESGTYYFDTLNSLYEHTYNITPGNMDFNMSITWSEYVIELFGLYYENGTFAGDIDVIAVTDSGSVEYNVNGNLTIYTTTQIRFIFWDLIGGGTRRLYPKDNDETFYLFTPHDTYSSYSFEVTDYIGAIGFQDSYLEMYGIVNTTTYLVERYLIWDTESTSPLTAMIDKIYSLQIRLPGDNIYSFGYWVPTTATPPTLTLSILDPDDYYQPISGIVNIEATRPNANYIKITYEDTMDLTLSVLVNITLRNETMVYNVTGSSALDVFNWYGAVNTTEYVVHVTVGHSYYGEIEYSMTLIGIREQVAPPSWDIIGIKDEWIWLGLVVVVAGTVSQVNAAAGLFAGASVASAFTYLGLLEIRYELLAGAFIISILMGLNKK